MQTEMSVEIDRPIGEVFEYTNNRVAEWSRVVIEDEILDEKPEVVGTTFRVVTEEGGQRMEFSGTVTRHDPPRRSAARLVGASFDVDVEYSFEDISGRTRVTQRSSVSGKGWFKLMVGTCGWMLQKSSQRALSADLANLKRLLESEQRDTAAADGSGG